MNLRNRRVNEKRILEILNVKKRSKYLLPKKSGVGVRIELFSKSEQITSTIESEGKLLEGGQL